MKKILAILLALLMCTGLLASAHAATISIARSKMSDELLAAFDSISANETVTAIVEMTDVDHNEVMATFAKMYPEEFVTYIRAKFDNLEETEYAGILTTYPFSQYPAGEIDGDVLQRAIEHKREIYRTFYDAINTSCTQKYYGSDEILFSSQYAPSVIIETSKASALQMALSSNVCSIALCPEDVLVSDGLDVANNITRANYVRDTKGNTGSGVIIGMIEGGVPDVRDDLLRGANIVIQRADEQKTDSHATTVASILVGTDSSGGNDGYAPNATLYTYGLSGTTADVAAFCVGVETLLSYGVNIINASMSFYVSINNENHYGTGQYNDICKWVDHIAVQHDVHFVATAGNLGNSYGLYGVSSPGMAYNAITTGFLMAGGSDDISQFSMTAGSLWMESSSTPRPEKPNIVASGDGFFTTPGTSFAAPQVAGIIAQLCSYNASLKTKQALIGAVLAASAAEKVDATGNGAQGDTFIAAMRVEGNEQISNGEGAGILDARWARGIIQYGNAWGYTITSFPYTKTVTIDASSNSVTRVAIFWLKRNTVTNHTSVEINASSPALTNLDLQVFDPNGNSVGISSTLYSNYEIVQFNPSVTGTYTIRINLIGTGSDKEHVGIAVW